jgi:hypothetical protein
MVSLGRLKVEGPRCPQFVLVCVFDEEVHASALKGITSVSTYAVYEVLISVYGG